MILTASLFSIFNQNSNMTDLEIEERARIMGMHYEDECKVFFEKGNE